MALAGAGMRASTGDPVPGGGPQGQISQALTFAGPAIERVRRSWFRVDRVAVLILADGLGRDDGVGVRRPRLRLRVQQVVQEVTRAVRP